MKTELKQCPFCGSEHLSIYHDDHVCSCKISCECGCSVEWADDDIKKEDLEKLVVEKWNTRVYPPEIREAINHSIARKPMHQRNLFGEIKLGDCPACTAPVNEEFRFCGDCGQKLNWSDYE